MKRLNETRANLKHRGVIPDESTVETIRVNVRSFFEENTPTPFDVGFSEVSLSSLIKYNATRRHAERAQECLDDKDLLGSLKYSAMAFHALLQEYKLNKTGYPEIRPGMGPVPFDFNSDLQSPDSVDDAPTGSTDFERGVYRTLSRLAHAFEVTCLGIDYRRYAKFNYLTPSATGHVTMRLSVKEIQRPETYEDFVTTEDAQYCIDFIVESALLVQGFDFTLSMPD